MGRLGGAGLVLAVAAAGCADPTVAPTTAAATQAAAGTNVVPTPIASVGPPTIHEFTPGSVSMWSRSDFILGGSVALNPGPEVQSGGTVALTKDAGRTFALIGVGSGPVVDVSVGPASEAWALGSSPDGSSVAPLFHSVDAGRTWSELPPAPALFSHVAFSFDGHGFALAIAPATEDQITGVYATDDGGTTWTPIGNPCPSQTRLVGLATASRHSAWVGCVGQPGTIEEPKVIQWTKDIGGSWATNGFVNPVTGAHLGNIPSQGHLTGLASGRGGNLWALQDRGWPLLSLDGGLTWKEVHLGEIDVAAAFAMTRDDHRDTVALLWNGNVQAVQLLASHDEGDTWDLLEAFSLQP